MTNTKLFLLVAVTVGLLKIAENFVLTRINEKGGIE